MKDNSIEFSHDSLFFCVLFRAASMAYKGSQAKGQHSCRPMPQPQQRGI